MAHITQRQTAEEERLYKKRSGKTILVANLSVMYMSCTLCTSKEEMSQEHLESCEGTEHERRGLNLGTWRGLLDFWRRMMKKLGATVT